MSNKRICPIRTTVIITTRLILCMANISSSTYFEIASCMKVAILNIVMYYFDGVRLLTSTSKQVLTNKTVIFQFYVF